MADRWQPVRDRAAQERATMLAAGAPPAGLDLALAALVASDLDVIPLAAHDPLLGGARALFDEDNAFVAYDGSLPPAAAAFSLAHELGHRCLHGDAARCTASDISDDLPGMRPPGPSGAVEAYSPHAQREMEANLFAAAFLIPAAELAGHYQAGERLPALAARYGVSETALANALATVLLGPSPPVAPAVPLVAPSRFPLDSSQDAAATVAAGPVLVDAGPGTGKTRTLIERILYLLREGVAAHQILALTFSNRAAGEMRERLVLAAPEAARDVTVGTFHAFCLQILREYGPTVGVVPPVLMDGTDGVALLERHLDELGLEAYFNLHNPGLWLRDILGAISRAKDELVGPERYAELAAAAQAAAPPDDEKAQAAAAKWQEVARVYAHYERLLAAHGAQDFGGLIGQAVALVRDHPAVRARLQERYRQILVDEYQDMNRASSVLLQALAGDGAGLWVVGDLRQAIYRFRGASPANIQQWEQDFPGGQRLALGMNYRSIAQLVGLFRAVGDGMPLPGAPPANWQPSRAAAPAPHLWIAEASTAGAEATGIAAGVATRHAAGRPYHDQAILCRTHRQAEPIARALERRGIPVLYLGPLCERPLVRDLLALMQLAAGDGAGLMRVGALADHFLPRPERIALIQYAQADKGGDGTVIPFPQALRHAAAAGLPAASVTVCARLADLLDGLGYAPSPWHFLARYLFGDGSTLLPRLLADASAGAAQGRLALGQLLGHARAWAERPTTDPDSPPLHAFLTYMRRLVAAGEDRSPLPPESDSLDAVRLLTIHASKGLEFPVIYLPNLAANRFPAREQHDSAPPPPGLMADEGADRLTEETCLFFVALSRARDELILSRAAQYGKMKYKPSQLLTLVQPYFAGTAPVYLQWTDGDAAGEELAAAPPAALRVLSEPLEMSAVELYMRCPRRYEYNRVIGLGEPDEGLAYKQFHDALHHVLTQLRRLWSEGALPDGADAVGALLLVVWEEHGPRDHAHAALYARIARDMAVGYWGRLRANGHRAVAYESVLVDIGGVQVRIKIDAAEETPDGTLRLVRLKPARLRDDDGRTERMALLRQHAAEATPRREIRIELESLTDGEVQPLKAGRTDAQRLQRVADAVAGLVAEQYPASPEAADDCQTCPYWIINPS